MIAFCANCGAFTTRSTKDTDSCAFCGGVRFWRRTGGRPSEDLLVDVQTGELLEPRADEQPPMGRTINRVVRNVLGE